MPGSMKSTSPAYITVRSPPFLASWDPVLLVLPAGFSELESSPPHPATTSASTPATANMARHCAANLICTNPPLGMGQGRITPVSAPVAAQRIRRGAPIADPPHRLVSRLRLEDHVLGALPEHGPAQLTELIAAFGDGQEMVPGELADDAREAGSPVREQDLRLAEAARVEQDLARCGVARVVLERQVGLEVAERDPGRLAAPADVEDLVAERQHRLEGGARGGRVGDPDGAELERAGGDAQVAHVSPFVGVSRRPLRATIWPSWKTVAPRRNVRTTLPRSGRPANGLSLWRSCSVGACRSWTSTSVRSASAPGCMPLGRRNRRAGFVEVSVATFSSVRRPLSSRSGSSVWQPAIPPQAAVNSPCFISGGHGEWSEATKAMSPIAFQSCSRSWALRSGGAHFARVPRCSRSSSVSVR